MPPRGVFVLPYRIPRKDGGKEKGALEAPALSSLRSAQWKMKRHSAIVARIPLSYRQDAGFLDGMSVEDYGQARARRLGESSAQ